MGIAREIVYADVDERGAEIQQCAGFVGDGAGEYIQKEGEGRVSDSFVHGQWAYEPS